MSVAFVAPALFSPAAASPLSDCVTASRAFWGGASPYGTGGAGHGFLGAPAVAAACGAVAWLRPGAASLAWAVLSAGLFWCGVSAWFRLTRWTSWARWLALAFCAMEADISLRYQQTQCLVVGLLLLGLALHRARRSRAAGILLGGAFLLNPAAILVWPALIGFPTRRFCTGIAMAILGTAMLPLAWLGPDAAAGMTHDCLAASLASEGSGVWRLMVGVLTVGACVAVRGRRVLGAAGVALASVLAALPLVGPRPQSADFVLLAPAFLLLARRNSLRAPLVVGAGLTTVIYTSLWPSGWLPFLRAGFRSKVPGTVLLWAVALLVLAGPLACRKRELLSEAQRRLASLKQPGGVLLVYLALTIAWARPLLPALSDGLPKDVGDPLLNTWILWWNSHTVPLSSQWWNAPIFHPATGTLALSEHLLGLSPLTSPIVWLSHNPVLAYNVAFLLSFPASAWTAYLLCRNLTGRQDAAFLAGLAFGFAPYRAAQLPHLQVLSSYWMPLAFLGLHRFASTGRWRWLVLFSASWVAQGLCNGYYLLFLPVLFALWCIWFVGFDRRLWPILVASGAVVLVVCPILLGYEQAHVKFGLGRDLQELQENAATWTSWLDAAPDLAISGLLPRPGESSEAWLFPGFGLLVMTVAGIAVRAGPARAPRARRDRWTSRTLWAAFAVGLLAGAAFAHREQPTTVAVGVLCLLGAWAAPQLVAAWETRSALAFYVGATLISWALCLGPRPRVPFGDADLTGPYALLASLPGFDALRAVARFAMLGCLCLSMAAGLGAARWLRRLGRLRRPTLLLAASLTLADGWVPQLHVALLPDRSALLEHLDSPVRAVLELPPGGYAQEYAAMYRAMHHGWPLVNGFSGFEPPHYAPLHMGLEARDPQLLSALAKLGPISVRVDRKHDPEGEWERYVASSPRSSPGPRADAESLFWLLPDDAPRPSSESHSPLSLRSVRADPQPDLARYLVDGDLTTRWSTGGPQVSGEYLDMELAGPQVVSAVVLSLGRYRRDFPRGIAIQTTEDGSAWSESWRGGGAGPAFEAGLEAPRVLPLRFEFAPRLARVIRVIQLGRDPVFHWSVAEVRVEGPRALPATSTHGVD